MPGALTTFLFLVRPGAPSSVLAPTSNGLQPNVKVLALAERTGH